MKWSERSKAFSRAGNDIYIQANSGRIKFVISLLLSSGLLFLDFSVLLFLLFHSSQLTQVPDTRGHAQVRENTGTGKGTVRGEPWQVSSDASARSPMVSRAQCEGSQGTVTLEAKANAAAKLKISMVNFRLSQVV